MSKIAIPRWMRYSGVVGRGIADLATNGLNLLLDAALHDGMYWRKGEGCLRQPRSPWQRLPGLVARLNVPSAAVVGPVKAYMDCFESKLGVELTPVMRLMKSMPGPEIYRLKELSLGELFRSVERLGLSNRRISVDDILRMDKTKRKELTQADLAQCVWPSPPFEQFGLWCGRLDLLLTGAAKALGRGPTESGLLPDDIDALATICLAIMALRQVSSCLICGRWSLPGHVLCEHHSLSAEAGGTANERQARYESGKLLLSKLPDGSISAHRLLEQSSLATVLAHLYWRSPFKGDAMWSKLTRQTASALPGFAELLRARPADMAPARIVDFLRASWDPLQINPCYWPDAALYAWRWNAAQAALSAPAWRRWESTDTLVIGAIAYAEHHPSCSATEIARHLGVARSTVSAWFVRRIADPNVSRLKDMMVSRSSCSFRLAAAGPRMTGQLSS